jgi:hypothetical protein
MADNGEAYNVKKACRFWNTCFDKSADKWLYPLLLNVSPYLRLDTLQGMIPIFTHTQEFRMILQGWNQAFIHISFHLLIHHQDIGMRWLLIQRYQMMLSGYEHLIVSFVFIILFILVVIWDPFWPENLGHMILDDLYPLYLSQLNFDGKVDPEIQPLGFRTCGTIFQGEAFTRCNKFYSEFGKGLTRKPFLDYQAYLHKLPHSLTCFKTLYLSMSLTYKSKSNQKDMWVRHSWNTIIIHDMEWSTSMDLETICCLTWILIPGQLQIDNR